MRALLRNAKIYRIQDFLHKVLILKEKRFGSKRFIKSIKIYQYLHFRKIFNKKFNKELNVDLSCMQEEIQALDWTQLLE